MSQFIGFGNGHDAAIPSSGTYGGTNQSCSGSSGSTTLTCGGVWTANDLVLIHQSRGTGVGQWEFNQIISDNGTNLTLAHPLSYTYTDSRSSQAQVIEVKEYTGGTISGTLTCSAWNENVGGILPIFCSGRLVISGTLSAIAKGFSGGGEGVLGQSGYQGEGTGGVAAQSKSANGSGGGGGQTHDDPLKNGGGGGGGHASTGGVGTNINGGETGGAGGTSSGSATLTTMTFGGEGGAGSGTGNSPGDSGGIGGGIIVVVVRELVTTGSISANGGSPTLGVPGGNQVGQAGTGAGGSVLIKTESAILGSNKITASYGSQIEHASVGPGGNGSVGRVRIETCSLSGSSSSPTPSYSTGGQDWCGVYGGII